MIEYNKVKKNRHKIYTGKGLVNTAISKLPFEFHLPGYQYCGPGTKLQERLARGDPGINPLDGACKEHDIAYSKYKNIEDRHIADRILAERAWQRVKSSDASFNERINAWLVTNAMKTKLKFGMGLKTKSSPKEPKTKLTLQRGVREARNILKTKKPGSLKEAIQLALGATRNVFKGKRKCTRTPRVIPIPRIGGVLPLIPIFAGLSALGALTGGTAGIAKAVNDASKAKQQLEESKRHNQTMEAIALGKSGKGLYLKPYRKGLGLYVNPPSKNY